MHPGQASVSQASSARWPRRTRSSAAARWLTAGIALIAALAFAAPVTAAAAGPAGRSASAAPPGRAAAATDPSWKTESLPSPQVPHGALNAVSCPFAGSCFGVGQYVTPAGKLTALAEHWNGRSWALISAPSPAKGSVLNGLSCSANNACTAVGSSLQADGTLNALAMRWNGSNWLVQAAPAHANSVDNSLAAVSCPSATSCTAVGHYTTASGKPLTLGERWNGTAWSVQATRNPAGTTDSKLAGVSCTSASFCMAAGETTDAFGTQVVLAERWNGSGWAIQSVRKPSTAGSRFEAVACPSSSVCTAVGQKVNSFGAPLPLAERWNGTGWAIQTTPNPSGFNSDLTGVDCATATVCTAVGVSVSDTVIRYLAERWIQGSGWSVQTTPRPAGLDHQFAGVSCASATMCVAVGQYLTPPESVIRVTAGELWVSGSGWSIQSTANPVGARAVFLAAVDCSSASACTAAGSIHRDVGPPLTLAERWNGTTWTLQTPPNPPDYNSFFTGISCPSATVCTAVGTSFRPENTKTLAEQWNGSSWSIKATPNPASADNSQLNGVSCTSASACTAVGFSIGTDGTQVALAERWNGSTWSLQSVPSPAEATGAEFFSVACTSATNCVAVGDYAGTGGMQVLAERWDGTNWSVQSTPDPAGDNRLLGVSCTTASACTAVGDSTDNEAGTQVTLAERWDGVSWSIQATPNPADHTSLAAVSCPTATACTAVGTRSGGQKTLAEAWDGSTWSVQATPAPGTSPVLAGVSCQSAVACLAVGNYQLGTSLPLAERYS